MHPLHELRRNLVIKAAPYVVPVVMLPVAVLVGLAAPAQGATPGSSAVVSAPQAGNGASVTVGKTRELTNETIEVSWQGFRPSSASQLQNGAGSFDTNTLFPVRVYQCRGTSPRSSSDCYGSPGFRGVPATDSHAEIPAVPGFTYEGQTDPFANLPDGPSNYQDTVTSSDGTGQVTIQIFTRLESPSLGCDESVECSVVVVPNYGRQLGNGDPTGATEDQLDAPWAWSNRVVIPLALAPVESGCESVSTTVSVEGSPLSDRALTSWRTGSCLLPKSRALGIDYTSLYEERARQDVASGRADVGLTTLALDSSQAETKVSYAPLAISGVVIAFQVDDADGRPVTEMKLNQRLVAKIITASYRIADDPNVEGNPKNLFKDPEFRELNPGVAWPSGAPGNHPILLGENSDMTWTLTRWIQADPDARAFLDGTPDPYGTHVNLAYKGLKLPLESFPVLDEKQSNDFEPIQGLDQAARKLSLAQFPGAVTSVEDGITIVTKPPRQNPGRREVIGIIDAANAQRFRLATASLANGAGEFVAPSSAGLRAGLKAMSGVKAKASKNAASNGVVGHVDHASKDRNAYPLTVVSNAMYRTDASGKRAASVSRFLEFAATQGQRPGFGMGELPPGYVPLPKDLRKQTLAASTLLAQSAKSEKPADNDKKKDKPGSTPQNSGGSGALSSSGSAAGSSASSGAGLDSGSSSPAGAGEGSSAAPGDGAVEAAASAGGEVPQQMLAAVKYSTSLSWFMPLAFFITALTAIAGPGLLYMHRTGRLEDWSQFDLRKMVPSWLRR